MSAYRDARTILADETIFQAGYDVRISKIHHGIALDESLVCHLYAINCYLSRTHLFQVQSFLFSGARIPILVQYFQHITGVLIKEKSTTHAGSALKYVDIVKDIVNLLPIYWIADELVS